MGIQQDAGFTTIDDLTLGFTGCFDDTKFSKGSKVVHNFGWMAIKQFVGAEFSIG